LKIDCTTPVTGKYSTPPSAGEQLSHKIFTIYLQYIYL
jgi:hypothetical protein